MNRKIAYAILLAAVFCTPGCKPASKTSTVGESKQSALRFHALNVGKTIDAGQTVLPLTLFEPTDKIIASVLTKGIAKNIPLSARLIAMANGQVLGERTGTITAAGPLTTNLEFPQQEAWPLGRYVVEVTLNGKLEGRQEIEVTQNLPH